MNRRSGHRLGRALLIESDDEYAALAALILTREGWEVDRRSNGQEALRSLDAGQYGVVLVSTSADPQANGESFFSALRKASLAPVIVLSSQDDRDEIIERALESADYDLIKPFSPRRLRAAVRAVTRRGRRAAQPAPLPAEVRAGDIALGLGQLEVSIGERRVALSPREFALLHLLIANPGTVFTREELARLAWGWRTTGDSRAVDNAVRRLRQKIEADPKTPRYLLTERGAGYRFAAP